MKTTYAVNKLFYIKFTRATQNIAALKKFTLTSGRVLFS